MIRAKYLNPEEMRLMNCHKWMESQKAGHDVGEEAFFNWAFNHERAFMEWAEKLPENCIHCGRKCCIDGTECTDPFNEHRIKYFDNI